MDEPPTYFAYDTQEGTMRYKFSAKFDIEAPVGTMVWSLGIDISFEKKVGT